MRPQKRYAGRREHIARNVHGGAEGETVGGLPSEMPECGEDEHEQQTVRDAAVTEKKEHVRDNWQSASELAPGMVDIRKERPNDRRRGDGNVGAGPVQDHPGECAGGEMRKSGDGDHLFSSKDFPSVRSGSDLTAAIQA